MVVSLRRARNALQNQGADSAKKRSGLEVKANNPHSVPALRRLLGVVIGVPNNPAILREENLYAREPTDALALLLVEGSIGGGRYQQI